MESINLWIALWAGVASFISPCCLPLYPSYISYITGISVSELKSGRSHRDVRIRTMLHTLAFILGFSIIFFSLGWTTGLLGSFLFDYGELLRQIAAILIFVMGLMLLGIFQPQWLMKERKFQINRRAGYLGSVLIGIGFAAGWSPCVGPILSAILALTATEPGTWLQLITAYILGFAIPFFVLSFFIGTTKWIIRYSNLLMKIGGGVMVIVAILLYTDQMTKITIWLNSITPDWLKF
ncbi:cytochrome c biogenesis protein CcdA [Paenibacillus larvae]|uniref:Cytochrome C biogenesis protein CcdA n=3 Tax=Paenibacillus larvae TaxID=1464 RepID=A0A1V0UWB4_9BACL|nr:cytochrome c biogenesis protein CcdA [Paenibacillus larvae]AQR76117.1 cytochrome C biogenesis protein CcdA [Paenibacillus larvae subsp. larvae]ARF69449.1 cytochrome C biogenesis protein CcdA [Paenibacillus larvae subsp. pulvifaciens]AVF23134.1 cytochrome c-type biogenesis protein CcdA [Paenibacillus larvae subsp. larvae]ETK26191.1 cytochrome c-type biogenesis protein CcdA [Paenibacillus larvae subsp. larvae DSM 25719]MCY7477095.1 cytochrome c biogenesis protein CcdA [Paenibacillus larvae]